jgi:hypothetical protein
MGLIKHAFSLKVPAARLEYWAHRYGSDYDDRVPAQIGHELGQTRFLTREQFLAISRWKSPRPQPFCERNSEAYVREVTAAAFAATEPRFKIEVLRLLDGVDWPTASAILHFCDAGEWPIMDYRAFWSLGQPTPAGRYDFALWSAYVDATRSLAREHAVSMRTLDRALWAYSKAKQ